MKEFAERLYKSKAWQKCRAEYLRSVGGVCERCLKKGILRAAVIVHHKTYLTPENIYRPDVTMNFANLEALCRECHEKEHAKRRRYSLDYNGRVTAEGES